MCKTNKHNFENIEGWFNFKDIYNLALYNTKDKGVMVEIGCWKGKSISYLATEMLLRKKNIHIHAIDTFKGSKEHGEVNGLYEEYIKNVGHLPIKTHVMDSISASNLFNNESIDFCFIDASHEYKDVKKDIEAWLPKIKKGGIIAGHDYDWSEVKQAVDESFECVFKSGTSWLVFIK